MMTSPTFPTHGYTRVMVGGLSGTGPVIGVGSPRFDRVEAGLTISTRGMVSIAFVASRVCCLAIYIHKGRTHAIVTQEAIKRIVG